MTHDKLMEALRVRISDGGVLRLIWRWLKAGVLVFGIAETTDEGTPQGGVLSPLLANVYLHGLDHAFAEMRPQLGAITRYADDFVVQCGTPAYAERALQWVREFLAERGLRLNPAKTRIVTDSEGFDFLGFHHRRVRVGGRDWNLRWPSTKACQRFRDRFCATMLKTGYVQTAEAHAEVIERVTRYLAGWRQYYRNGHSSRVFAKLDYYVRERLARFQARCQPKGKHRHKRPWRSFVTSAGGYAQETQFGKGLADHESAWRSEYPVASRVRENLMHGSERGCGKHGSATKSVAKAGAPMTLYCENKWRNAGHATPQSSRRRIFLFSPAATLAAGGRVPAGPRASGPAPTA